jgi:hypothetical protein
MNRINKYKRLVFIKRLFNPFFKRRFLFFNNNIYFNLSYNS